MTKAEIIREVANATGKSIAVSEEIINAFLNAIQKAVSDGDYVNFIGFGKFEAVDREERLGHNPHTGEKIVIAAHKIPHFKPGDNFKKAVRG